MHLSLFSDAALPRMVERRDVGALAHRDGLLRGLALLGVFALLAGLTFLGNTIHSVEADAAPFACRRPAPAHASLLVAACRPTSDAPAEASVYLRP